MQNLFKNSTSVLKLILVFVLLTLSFSLYPGEKEKKVTFQQLRSQLWYFGLEGSPELLPEEVEDEESIPEELRYAVDRLDQLG